MHAAGPVAAVIAAAVAASAIIGVSAQQPTPQPCVHRYMVSQQNVSKVGATWDFTPLFNPTQDYVWEDDDDFYTINATYQFQMCGNVNSAPNECSAKLQQLGPAPALQITRDPGGRSNACYLLGRDQRQKPIPRSFRLIDPYNPARGLIMQYGGGESTGCDFDRQFMLELYCEPRAAFPPPDPSPPSRSKYFTWIDEVEQCRYIAHSYSPYGCPAECLRVNGVVCGGRGVCGWDSDALTARCFCDDGYMEADCQTPRTPVPAGSITGAVFGGILLGAAGLLGGLVWMQRKAAAAKPVVEGFYA